MTLKTTVLQQFKIICHFCP